MIREGPKAKCQSTRKRNQAALTLAQLLKFKNVKQPRKTEECTRHVKSQETPLPVYIGVMLHLKTRKRDLIDRLHSLGMSVSYDEVLGLSSDMANAVCEHFKETDAVYGIIRGDYLYILGTSYNYQINTHMSRRSSKKVANLQCRRRLIRFQLYH